MISRVTHQSNISSTLCYSYASGKTKPKAEKRGEEVGVDEMREREEDMRNKRRKRQIRKKRYVLRSRKKGEREEEK